MLKGPKMWRSESTESSASTESPKSPMNLGLQRCQTGLGLLQVFFCLVARRKRKVSLWQDACYNTSEKKTEKVMEIYQNCCKISTTGRFGNPLFVETRDFLPTFYVCNRAISPRVGNCHLSPSLSRHGRRCCHGGLRPTRLWRGWLSQLRSSTPSATCLREKPVTLAPLSWTPRWDAPLGHKDDLFEHLEM